jgi:hypothetical protein
MPCGEMVSRLPLEELFYVRVVAGQPKLRVDGKVGGLHQTVNLETYRS